MEYLNLILPIIFIILCLGLFIYSFFLQKKFKNIKQLIFTLENKKDLLTKEININQECLDSLQKNQEESKIKYNKIQEKIFEANSQLKDAT